MNALALVAAHPDEVRTLIAHEPPLPTPLPDREAAMAVARAVHETYEQRGRGAGMAHFITLVSHRGEFTADFAQQPGRIQRCSACQPRTTAHGPTRSQGSPSWGPSSTSPTSTPCAPRPPES